MDGQAWVQLALEKLGCTQKELALRLGVSPTQISKWKNDDYMSFDMDQRFRDLTGIGTKDPSFVVLAGSFEDANKWERLIKYLAELAAESAETGYDTPPLQEELDLLCWRTLHLLEEIGVALPSKFPSQLDVDYESGASVNFEVIEANQYYGLIYRAYKSYTDLYGFFAAYVHELVHDDELDLYETGLDVESHLLALAVCKIEVDRDFAPGFSKFKRNTLEDYRKWLGVIKDKAFRAGIPLRAELLDLVHESHDALGHNAEAESLGVNDRKLHPDIYMNELLCGMRAIHQVLPAIMQKLGIEEEFQLDVSEFSVG